LLAQNDDIPFYLEQAKKQNSPILDLAAGTGRVTIPLAEAGFKIFSLESSEAMLNQTKKKITNLSREVRDRITLIHGDMTDFQLEEKFKLIIIPNSFGHCLTTEKQLSCLKCISTHLSNDGLFILDLFPGGTLREKGTFKDNPVKINHNKEVVRTGIYYTDFIKQILELELKFEIYQNAKVIKEITEHSKVAVIFNREINLLLKNAEFEIREQFCNWTKQTYEPNLNCSRRILVLCLK